MYDVIIIGAGPAGISSSLYAISRGLKTLVIEECERIGGTLRSVSNITHFAGYPSGNLSRELVSIWDEQLIKSGVKIINETITSTSLKGNIKSVCCLDKCYEAKSIIIAAGTKQNIPEIKDEDDVLQSHLHNDAIKYVSNYKNVVVLGGSDGAAKEAICLSKRTDHVDMIVVGDKLECVNEFTEQIDSIKYIDVHLNSKIVSVEGKDIIESVKIKNVITNETKNINYKNMGIFYYIGSTPNSSSFKEIKTENGYILTDENMHTSINGVYAAGDIRKKTVRQISTAIGDGAIAAIEASKYVLNKK